MGEIETGTKPSLNYDIPSRASGDIIQLAMGVSRAEVALRALREESLSAAQIAQLAEILSVYKEKVPSCGDTSGAILSATAETDVGQAIMSVQRGKRRLMIVSGGQSGVDRAALDCAADLRLASRGWCPAARWAEDGPIEPRYSMQECGSADPAVRTELNTVDSDATLVLTKGNPTDGTPLTGERAASHGKPTLVLSLEQEPDLEAFWNWIAAYDIRVLNVGGPRESFAPGEVYRQAREVLDLLLDPTTPRRRVAISQVENSDYSSTLTDDRIGVSRR